jgi:hypothetical protein
VEKKDLATPIQKAFESTWGGGYQRLAGETINEVACLSM